jgi:hypothetical protein
MKNLLKSFLFILKLFFTSLIISFTIASVITYYITSVKFAFFLAVVGCIPSALMLTYFSYKWQNDLL